MKLVATGFEDPGGDGIVVDLLQADSALRVLLLLWNMSASAHHRVVPSSSDSSEPTGGSLCTALLLPQLLHGILDGVDSGGRINDGFPALRAGDWSPPDPLLVTLLPPHLSSQYLIPTEFFLYGSLVLAASYCLISNCCPAVL